MGKGRELRVEAYVRVNGETVKVKNLSEEQQRALALWLKRTWLNALFQEKLSWEEETT